LFPKKKLVERGERNGNGKVKRVLWREEGSKEGSAEEEGGEKEKEMTILHQWWWRHTEGVSVVAR
jgi:hypothetical protein